MKQTTLKIRNSHLVVSRQRAIDQKTEKTDFTQNDVAMLRN